MILHHGKEVKKNVEDGGKTYKKEDIAEEDFAELFAENKGNLKAVEDLLGKEEVKVEMRRRSPLKHLPKKPPKHPKNKGWKRNRA